MRLLRRDGGCCHSERPGAIGSGHREPGWLASTTRGATMRTALRSAAALALAVPFIASALPASASSTYTSRESGSYADVYFQGPGTPGGVDGNYSVAGLTFQGDFSYGWVETFQCDPGETPGGGQEVGDCEPLGSYDAQVTDLTVVTGKGKDAASTYSGTVDLYEYTEDQGPVEPT